MVTIGMNYRVLPGQEAVFERACDSVLDVMAADAGHVSSRIFKDTKAPDTYLILSEWKDEENFQAFVRSEAFAKVTQWGKERVLAERPSHTTYR